MEKGSKTEKEIEVFHQRFTLQMATMSGSGPSQIQKPGTASESHTWVAKNQIFEPFSDAFSGH